MKYRKLGKAGPEISVIGFGKAHGRSVVRVGPTLGESKMTQSH